MYKSGNYSNNTSSSETKISSDYGGDWTQGNSNFSYNTLLKAKDMAQQQLDRRKFKKTVIPEN